MNTQTLSQAAQPVTLLTIPLSAIYLADNYRSSIDPVGLKSLAESIRTGGLIQPVAVRPLAVPFEGYEYALVAGFRRFAAHELGQLPTILATVRDMTDQEAQMYRLVENILRENPHPADEAVAVGKLSREGMNTEEIAAYLGQTARWVTQRRAISELLPEWLTDLRQDKLTLGAAEELSRWPESVQRRCLDNRSQYVVNESTVKNWVAREKQALSSAPWPLDDAALYENAGACTGCPKRSSCSVMLFAELAEEGKDTCLDSACWNTKMGRRIEQVLAEQKELAGEAPVVRLSTKYYEAPAGAVKPDKYEVSKRKKGTVVGVYVDGASAATVVRVLLAQETTKALESGKVELSQGEKNRETRQKRLLKEAGKRVLAERCYHALQLSTDEAKQGRVRVLAKLVAESLMQGRVIDLLTLAELTRTWGWPLAGKNGPDTKGLPYREWVEAQVLLTAPTEALLTQLLLFSVTHRGLGSEWNDNQKTAASLVGNPQVQEGLDEATQALFEREYDPRTLRARKVPLVEVTQLVPADADEQPGEQCAQAA
ncbi:MULTISPECIES: ParB/RepB/Spo0J family partition protein [Hymenobacter]|uniref:ParB/RepB/Spo0J family partition protein n=1 Tax=Hymenobacter guriensis TaxID=2793065 RepID=A0ABS0L490_9BACT|nr:MULTISPECIES: ParB/RepB/Spo0J family partition protein [Hymenobacter]MBG8554963.1 ParB/RepB/Spo0J family partition protein [Hymenobacter guriensis]MCR5890435.1 ParB/RepB/Spo0J family partition protein [Hymenobacter sp. J193]